MSKPSFIKRILSLGKTEEAADPGTEGVVATDTLEAGAAGEAAAADEHVES